MNDTADRSEIPSQSNILHRHSNKSGIKVREVSRYRQSSRPRDESLSKLCLN